MRVLVLNASYEFLGVTDWQSAVSAAYTNKVIVEEVYDKVVHSPSISMNVPAVIRLRKYVKVAYERLTYVSYTKRNVHLRDRYVCQYCASRPKDSRVTIDHVIPESRGGLSTWDNTVTACKGCNMMKEDKTPQEAGMHLIRVPGKPRGFREILHIKLGELHDIWLPYLKE